MPNTLPVDGLTGWVGGRDWWVAEKTTVGKSVRVRLELCDLQYTLGPNTTTVLHQHTLNQWWGRGVKVKRGEGGESVGNVCMFILV